MTKLTQRLASKGLAFIFTAAMVTALQVDAVELVGDLNDGRSGYVTFSGYDQAADFPNATLLALIDEAHGSELWTTDYTPQGTRLLRDIFPGRADSFPGWYVKLGNITVFTARDATHGTEMWRSDGTSAGTYMLADIGPGAQNYGGGYPSTVLNDVLYFAADDGVTGNELWRTDGTREGTYLVADIVPGYEGSYPVALTAAANTLIFAREGQLWVSDGTSAGTHKVIDINLFRCCEVAGNAVFFTANDGVHGMELWRADTDGQNVRMVANLNTEPEGAGQDGSSDPTFVFRRGDSLYYSAHTPLVPPVGGTASECRLYRADPTGTGLTELVNLHRCGISKVINLPAGTMFSLAASGGGDLNELWITDGTPAGTAPLDLNGLYYSTTVPTDHFKAAYGDHGEAYFFGHPPGNGQSDNIWRTDGTRAGTRVFAELPNNSRNQEIAYLNGWVYFDSGFGNTASGDELWTSNGTPAGTFMMRDILPGPFGSQPSNLRVANGRLHFFAAELGDKRELFTSDGSTQGIVNLGKAAEAASSATGDSNVAFAGQLGSRVVFAADRGPAAKGRELNISDGTRAGTVLIRDINTGGSADPDNFLPMGNQMLFVAKDYDHERELWRTDGTEAGTFMLADIARFDGNVTLGGPGTILGGVAYFTAGETLTYPELWRTDGTVAGTFKVPGDVGMRVRVLGGNGTSVLYQALTNATMRLRSWNGTQSQIIAAADALKITADPGVTFGGRVCFRAWDVSPQHIDVWCASGVPGDLVRATNFASLGLSAGEMRALGNKLLVNALGSGASAGLYATTGMVSGMQRISGERIAGAKPFGSAQLVFSTEAGGLMLTDGTSAGTRNLLQGVTLPGNVPGAFGVLGSYVVFMVNDPQLGAVVWRTDGTPAGTRYLADLDAAGKELASTEANQFFTLGDRLLFSGYKTGIGNELWSLNASDPHASDDSAAATGGIAIITAVLANDADFDGALNATTVSIVAQPAHGTATVNVTTGAISYTATTTYSGTDTLTYRVSDDQGRQSNVASISFTVTAGATPPPPTTPPTTPPASGGGGGGALGLELCGLLAFAAWAGRRRRRPDIG